MKKSDTFYWLMLSRLPGLGPVKIRYCLSQFPDIPSFFSATKKELMELGLSEIQIRQVKEPNLRAIERDWQFAEKNHCHILSPDHPHYPRLLAEIPDAPLVLFVQGNASLLGDPQIAIVGSRNPSVTGIDLATQFAEVLSGAGLVITSGLATGIDAASHQGALRACGKTIAVLGAGLNHIYPVHHLALAEAIIQGGALVSEFSPFEKPMRKNFPRRNRIISGLSLGVLVVEAALRSGSLITARYATEQGREVFAIPGSLHNPRARGCHQLIRQGAKLIETAEDILEELGPLKEIARTTPGNIKPRILKECDVESKRLLDFMGYDVTSMDVIILRSGLTSGEVSSMLLTLELQNLVQRAQGGYIRVL